MRLSPRLVVTNEGDEAFVPLFGRALREGSRKSVTDLGALRLQVASFDIVPPRSTDLSANPVPIPSRTRSG